MYLGVDLGTGSVKVALFDEHAHLVREAARPYPVNAPHPGWAESHPDDWWRALGHACHDALRGDALHVRAVGLSGQMHGVVLCDERAAPTRPAVLWADTRSTRELDDYHATRAQHAGTLRNPVTTGMAGPTLLWLARHEPRTSARARWALQPKDWLRLKLTGVAAAEPSDASATLLYDFERDTWDDTLIDDLGLRRDQLAPVTASHDPAGPLLPAAARHLGLPAGLTVVTGAADTAAALLGTRLPPRRLQLTVGTGAQLVVRHRHLESARPALHLFRTAEPTGSYTLGAVQNAGLALEWARRMLGCTWDEFYALADHAPPGSANLVFLPYLTGDRTPHLDPHARGGWIGATLQHDRAHLARAAFEGVALSIREALRVMPHHEGPVRLAGGGSVHPWWRQLLADVLERPLEIHDVPSASARGAAMLAMPDLAPAEDHAPNGLVEPRPLDLADVAARFADAYHALHGRFRTAASPASPAPTPGAS